MRMDWNKLLISERLGDDRNYSAPTPDRSQFQRDYDRLIFSSPFRRLQNKTQVFPLPGNIFVHNRLTHSLEVASVGRSLGVDIAQHVKRVEAPLANPEFLEEIGTIVGTACLAHDLGNPPFGHSGENAISHFFEKGKGSMYKSMVSEQEWNDFSHFEGNANAFRLLTHSFKGRRKGGFAMTYTTLATVVKYPHESIPEIKKGFKYGFFQADKGVFQKVAEKVGLIRIGESPLSYCRHPLVYAVEAADDICYQLMDIEDAQKLKILSFVETFDLLSNFCSKEEKLRNKEVFEEVTDKNEQIAFLRSIIINKLIRAASKVFVDHYDAIMEGRFEGALLDYIDTDLKKAFDECRKIAVERIYYTRMVTQILVAGFRIFSTLLDEYIEAVNSPMDYYSRNLLMLMPEQYHIDKEASNYEKIMSVLDYVSGMSDSYALDNYRKLKGMDLPIIGY